MINQQRDYSRLSGTVFERSKTQNLKSLVVGTGALGSEIIKNLCLIGTGSILIVDCDTVEPSDLTRSILFSTPDIERHINTRRPKASLAAARAREINSDVHAEAFVGEIGDLGLARLQDFDIVFSALDNEMARLELGWACTSTDRLMVDGGLGLRNYSSGLLSIYPGAKGPCYACRKTPQRRSALLTSMSGWKLPGAEREHEAQAREVVTTTPLMASIIAAIQVEEGIRAFLDRRPVSEGRSLEVTLHPQPRLERFTYDRNQACPLHDLPTVSHTWSGSSARTKISDLIDFVESHERRSATMVLRWPIVVSAYCRDCGKDLFPMICECGSRQVIEGEPVAEVSRKSKWAGSTLVELGLPENHIHEFIVNTDREKRLISVVVRD
jgi:adenylyltransferase/sulfurtransferase